ncbi:MAG: hypothetical protein K2W99_03370 [Chthoniobacterales bacterium]|nr:hypothetical protein [Chthoniobacterales bacterium]
MNKKSPYQEFLAERDEILRLKWLESEKRGYDIGPEQALMQWITQHRTLWKKNRKERQYRLDNE